MFYRRSVAVVICLLASIAVLCSARPASGTIYQWAWIDPANPELGKQQTTTPCPGGVGVDPAPSVDLSYRDLGMAYLPSANLTSANCYDTTLSSAELSNATLSNANCSYASLTYSNLTNANLSQANLYGANVSYANLTNANLNQANCGNAYLFNSNLATANLSQANLNNANFSTATLTGADLTDAAVQWTSFGVTTNSGFTAAQLYSTAGYKAKDLTGIGLYGNDLSSWNFSAQNMTNAQLDGSNLTNANLSQATLTYASITSANLTSANSSQANLNYTNLSYANLTNANFNQANLSSANLYSATLTGANLTDATVQWTSFTSTTATGFTAAQLYSTASYKAQNLYGIKLDSNDLSGWNFAAQNLSFANLTVCNLTNANLSQANLWGVDLSVATLTGANLTDAAVQYARFTDTTATGFTAGQLYSTASYKAKDLSGIKLDANDLSGWNFAGQNLGSADLSSSNLTNANFNQANMSNASLANSILAGANLTDATVQWTSFTSTTATGFTAAQLYSTASYKAKDISGIYLDSNDLSGWNFAGQNLSNAYLSNSNLTNAKFSQANLNYVYLSNDNLTNANLNQANLYGANLSGTTLTGADLTDAMVQWTSFTNTTSTGFTSAQLYSTAGYKAKDLTGIGLDSNNLSGWNFAGLNLTGANFSSSDLTNANLSQTNLNGATLSSSNLANANLSHTNLNGVNFYYASLLNANLSQANLMNTYYYGATLTGADFSAADTRGAQNLDLSASIATNTILPNGAIQGLHLSGGRTLVVRNYDYNSGIIIYPGVTSGLSLSAIPITVQQGMDMGTNGILQIQFGQGDWNSTIYFAPGIPVALGGTLNLDFAQGVGVLSQIGKKLAVFDWSGVTPTGTFNVTSGYVWDLAHLYDTGEVTLTYAPNIADTRWTGAVSGSWRDAGNWTAGMPAAGAIVEFNAATPAHQPILQNIGNPLTLDGILFAPGAGEHILAGPTILLSGSAPAIVCTSAADQYIGNAIQLDSYAAFSVTGAGVLTLAGQITSPGGIIFPPSSATNTKTGPGTLALANTFNSSSWWYSATTFTIEEGTLALDATGQMANTSLLNNATFQILAGDHTLQSITGDGETQVLSGSLTVNSISQGTITLGPGVTLSIAAIPGGPSSGSLTPVPEPATIGLLVAALISLAAVRLFARKPY